MWKFIKTAMLIAGARKLWSYKFARKYIKRYFLGKSLVRLLPV